MTVEKMLSYKRESGRMRTKKDILRNLLCLEKSKIFSEVFGSDDETYTKCVGEEADPKKQKKD